MSTKFRIHETLENAFIAGLLLTGSVERAESAILESVRISCPDDLFSEALFRRVVHYSINQQVETPTAHERDLDRAESILPFELRCVLRLSLNLRYCYVLRILVGLPREVCAWLLQMDSSQIDEYTCAAILELPRVQEKMKRCTDIGSERKAFQNRNGDPSNFWRLSRSSSSYGQRSSVALFKSSKIIQFNKLPETS